MKVLIIPTWYITNERPDCGNYFRDQALAMHGSGVQTGVVYVDISRSAFGGKLQRFDLFKTRVYIDQDIPTVRMNGLGLSFRFKAFQVFYARLVAHCFNQYVRQFGMPDIIHAHGYPAAYATSGIKQRWGIPFVYTEHLTLMKGHRYPAAHHTLIEQALKNADAVTAVSSALAGWMQEKTRRKIQVVPNLVNTEVFHWKAQAVSDKFCFLHVGDLIPRKSPDLILKAFAKLVKKYPGAPLKLDLIGKGVLMPSLKQLAESLEIQAQVQFWGLLPPEKVAEQLQSRQCLLLSSSLETFGVVLAEALVCGVPIIATDCGGPADLVTPENGYLVRVNDVEEFAAAMMRMFEQYARFDQKAISEAAIARYGHEAVATRWQEIYANVANIGNLNERGSIDGSGM
ncbi:MAG: glycosyltransferase [Bacteroidota bacterium]